MNPRILPIDPTTKIMNRVVWRFNFTELARLELLFRMDPLQRAMTLMGLITGVARRDEVVRKILSEPGVVDGLKKLVIDRQVEITEPAAEQEKPLG